MELAIKIMDQAKWFSTPRRYRLKVKWQRIARAWRYALNRTTPADASLIEYEMKDISGCYPLEYLTVESVMALVEDRYGEDPRFEELAHDAARRVWNKWDSGGHQADAAQDWAMDLFKEYAKGAGIELVDSYDAD
jgi:hypothetical protein